MSPEQISRADAEHLEGAFIPRIEYVLKHGAAITEDMAGPDVERLPLTEEEVSELGENVSRGGR